MALIDGTGLGHLIEKIKAAFVAKADTTAVTAVGVDTVPTENSDNLITSGAVYTGLSGKADSSSVHSIPSGGSAGQVLSKIDGTDYNAVWVNGFPQVVEVDTASSTIAAQMNTIYQWTVNPTDITVTLPSPPIDITKEIRFKFLAINNQTPTVSLPYNISWKDGTPLAIEQDYIYDIVFTYGVKDGWLCNPRRYLKGWIALPAGYTQYLWIGKSAGTGYINTGYVPKTKPRIITSYYFTATMDADLFGSAGSPYFIFNPGVTGVAGQNIYYKYGDKTSGAFTATGVGANYWHTVDAKEDITIDGTTYAWATSWDYSNNAASVYIFGGRNHTIVNYRLKRVKLFDGDTLVRDLIPCTDPNNVAGMYDVVNGVFYASAEVGQTFEVGN